MRRFEKMLIIWEKSFPEVHCAFACSQPLNAPNERSNSSEEVDFSSDYASSLMFLNRLKEKLTPVHNLNSHDETESDPLTERNESCSNFSNSLNLIEVQHKPLHGCSPPPVGVIK